MSAETGQILAACALFALVICGAIKSAADTIVAAIKEANERR